MREHSIEALAVLPVLNQGSMILTSSYPADADIVTGILGYKLLGFSVLANLWGDRIGRVR
jgi:hypothetical protein